MKKDFVKTSGNSCGLCKWHSQRMLRSGRDPIYEHFCGHPDAPLRANNLAESDSQILAGLLGRDLLEGVFIGKSCSTPGWCPVGAQD